MCTEKLYDQDSHLFSFDAVITGVCQTTDGYAVVLDRTAFFPEGGGQSGDTGSINGFSVADTRISEGEIRHYLSGTPAFLVGESVHCELDAAQRFARMQAHSGEHIVSGLAYRLFGAENVGFHMDDLVMTVDFNMPLNKMQLCEIEEQANRIVWQNKQVRVFYPTTEEASRLSFRCKLENVSPLRLVEIEDCDLCACCAPHVNRTGEIGLIKILTSCSHRGGVRITMVCGQAAYRDYYVKYENCIKIAALVKTPHNETYDGVLALQEKLNRLNGELREERKNRIAEIVASIPFQKGNIVYAAQQFDMPLLLRLAEQGKTVCDGVFVALSGDDGKGYFFAAASRFADLGASVKEITSALHGRGGGRGPVIQGTFFAPQCEIRAFFEQFPKKLQEEEKK